MDDSADALGAVRAPTRQAYTPRYIHHIEPEQGADLQPVDGLAPQGGPAVSREPPPPGLQSAGLSGNGRPPLRCQSIHVCEVGPLLRLDVVNITRRVGLPRGRPHHSQRIGPVVHPAVVVVGRAARKRPGTGWNGACASGEIASCQI